MDKFLTKKRSADDEVEVIDQPAKEGRGRRRRSVFERGGCGGGRGRACSAPDLHHRSGASGGDCKELAEVLSRLGTVRGVAKWAGNFPGQMPRTSRSCAPRSRRRRPRRRRRRRGRAPRRVVVVGHSFGCRVAVALMLQHADGTGPPLPEGFCGDRACSRAIRSWAERAVEGTDRVARAARAARGRAAALRLGRGRRVPQRGGPRGWRTGGPRVAALQEVVDSLACRPTCAVLPVEGARHNSLKVAKKSQLAVEGRFVAAVKRFLAAE